MVIEYIETSKGEVDQLSALQSSKVSQETVRTIFSGMYTILSAALKQPGLKLDVRLWDCGSRGQCWAITPIQGW